MIIISNGGGKFHLAPLASEMSKRGLLASFITMTYPTARIRAVASVFRLSRYAQVARMLQRGEAIPEECIVSLNAPEAARQTAMQVRRFAYTRAFSYRLEVIALRLYGRMAVSVVRRASGKARIYHYRAGMGNSSVQAAKKLGMFALCDHSIAHPVILEYMVTHEGAFPPPDYRSDVTTMGRIIREDINQADGVLVNSEFVKATMVHQGWNPSRVHVIYLGVDDQFLDNIPTRSYSTAPDAEMRLMFAGSFQQRKGVDILAKALMRIRDLPWRFSMATHIDSAAKQRHREFLNDPKISQLGLLSRAELARRMSEHDIFVFPSLAEGSARVVFEALACGCYVITTPNAGSIVEEGVHGALVPPGDVDALEAAIRKAIIMGDRIAEIGRRNAELVRTRYRQQHYGDAVEQLYKTLLE